VPRSLGLLAEGSFQDPRNARLLYLASGGLLLLGLALGVGTWWWWRSSKVEHPALGPLEVMSQRNWRAADFESQRRRLDEARPEGARRQFVPPDEIELDVATREAPSHFDDLAEVEAADASVETADGSVETADGSVETADASVEARVVIDPLLRPEPEWVAPPPTDDTPA